MRRGENGLSGYWPAIGGAGLRFATVVSFMGFHSWGFIHGVSFMGFRPQVIFHWIRSNGDGVRLPFCPCDIEKYLFERLPAIARNQIPGGPMINNMSFLHHQYV